MSSQRWLYIFKSNEDKITLVQNGCKMTPGFQGGKAGVRCVVLLEGISLHFGLKE